MAERRDIFVRDHDWIRKALMFEPRGHDAMSGAMIYPSIREDCDFGVLFIEVSGCLPMCGAGTIGLVTVALEEGLEEGLDAGLGHLTGLTRLQGLFVADTQLTDALRPWTYDFHVAQNDGEVKGSGDHDKTGKHCLADDPNGKLDITKCAGYWLKGAADRGIEHICWDGCMFPNATLENPDTWNAILKAMIDVRDAHGWE